VGARKPKALNKRAKIGYGHIFQRLTLVPEKLVV
jgi:hypothetical protein